MVGADAPGKATFLATDVEGSTRLWELDGTAMRSALERHDLVLSETFNRHHGRIFKHTGDGVYAVFEEAELAVRAAIAAQQRLCKEPWPAPAFLRVRMALVTGEARWDGNDYRGPALNRCARFLAVGHGGQVLLGADTAQRLRDLPDQSNLLDLGEHLLRDLPEPERIYRLVHPDLPTSPTTLRFLSGARHNLPEEWSSFVGRTAEVAAIRPLIESHRLVSLVGAPGCGKTRLALRLGRDVLDEYPGGVWFAPLAQQTDPSLVAQSVGRKLGVVERPDQPYLNSILERLRRGRMLLILDNCEHLLEACAGFVARLLAECGDLRVVTTTREPLAVMGEQTWRVPPMPLPAEPAQDEASDAELLFIERAFEADARFDPDGHRREIRDVCVKLDGLPLAIELAAARLRTMTIVELARNLSNRFRLLAGGTRTASPHQHTLHSTIDWSYRLLEPDAQRAMNRLSVFVKGFDLDSAAVLVEAPSEAGAIDLIAALVDKSLVIADRTGTVTRYSMLETIRAFGNEKLNTSGEELDARRRHAEYFLTFAEQAHERLHGPDQLTWLARLEIERGNLRAAWTYSLERHPPWAYRLGNALAWFWALRGGWHEARARLEQLRELPVDDPWLDSRARLAQVELEVDSGSPRDEIQAMIEEAREVCASIGDDAGLGRLLLAEAKLAGHREHVDFIIELTSAAIDLLESAGETSYSAEALIVQGEARFYRFGVEPARSCFAEGLDRFESQGDRRGASAALAYLGEMEALRGRLKNGVELIERSLMLAHQMGDRSSLTGSIGSSEVFLGRALRRLGKYPDARASFRRAAGVNETTGNMLGWGWATANLAIVELESGDFESADELIHDSFAVMKSIGYDQGMAWIESTLARLRLLQGDVASAHELAVRASVLERYRGDLRAEAESKLMMGKVALGVGDLDRAERSFRDSRSVFASFGILANLPDVLEGLAGVWVVRRDAEEARSLLEQAAEARTEFGTPVPRCDLAGYESMCAAAGFEPPPALTHMP